MKRKIVALTMDGKEVRRTTTLPLSHYWQTRWTRPDGTLGGMSGFASGEDRARKAAASESSRIMRGEECTNAEHRTHIVPVTVEQ